MLKIRLMRIGGRQRPFYRVVAVDERAKRTGAYVELLGTYNPLTEPKEIKLKQDRIDHWVKQGAQMSDGFLRIIGKAKQRPPRKAKKAAKTENQQAGGSAPEQKTEVTEQPKIEDKPTEEQLEQTTTENVIPSESEESVVNETQNEQKLALNTESGDSSQPEAVQNDKVEEENTDERPA